MLVPGCSKHPPGACKDLKPCGLRCGEPTQAFQPQQWEPGLMLSQQDPSGLLLSWQLPGMGRGCLCTGLSDNSASQGTGLLLRADLNPAQMPSLWVMSSPSPFSTLSPRVAALRCSLWKDIIILSSPSLSLFPVPAPHRMAISSHHSRLNSLWKHSGAMRHHYLFCQAPFKAVAE